MTRPDPSSDRKALGAVLEEAGAALEELRQTRSAGLEVRHVGRVEFVSEGVARVRGLHRPKSEELVRFRGERYGMVLNLDPEEAGIVLLDESEAISVGTEVRRTGRVLDVPVGEGLVGRVVDALGRPLDDAGDLSADERRPLERPAPGVMDRAPVQTPLQTGIKAVDALIPIGRGQRELIVGDRQTGKTAIALDAIANQRDTDVLCIYCAVGQRDTAVAKAIAGLREREAMDYTTILVAGADDPPGLQFACPFAAMSMAEFFMEQGRHVLLVLDDLTRHAQAYRELSLLLRRPPGREAYPGDVFFLHSRLLERATRLVDDLGGGSITALPVIETQAQNIAAYIPTNLISITDGQIYLSPVLFQKGHLPAIDVGKSVSRVGGKAQLPAYGAFAGDLRLSYSQFEELEMFSRFGTRLDEETRRTLEHGQRVREILKQPRFSPLTAAEQVVVLLAAGEGLLDDLPLSKVRPAEDAIRQAAQDRLQDLATRIAEGDKLEEDDRRRLLDAARKAVRRVSQPADKPDPTPDDGPDDEPEPAARNAP